MEVVLDKVKTDRAKTLIIHPSIHEYAFLRISSPLFQTKRVKIIKKNLFSTQMNFIRVVANNYVCKLFI